MNKTWRLLPVVAATASLIVITGPAEAQSRRIQGTSVGQDSGLLFRQAGCKAELAADAPNGLSGIDSIIARAPSPGTTINTSWSVKTVAPGTAASLSVSFIDGNCVTVMPANFNPTRITTGAWAIPVPANAAWIVFTAHNGIDTTVNF
jgi:hypothetical protein